jgi:hypothetical protein
METGGGGTNPLAKPVFPSYTSILFYVVFSVWTKIKKFVLTKKVEYCGNSRQLTLSSIPCRYVQRIFHSWPGCDSLIEKAFKVISQWR